MKTGNGDDQITKFKLDGRTQLVVQIVKSMWYKI